MRVAFSENIRNMGGRLRPVDWLAAVEKLFLGLLALLCAALVWAVLTPVGSFGPWEGRQARFLSVAARQALFSRFDPFYRGGPPQADGGVVTSLALTVYGIRLNEGSGLGSAIVARSEEHTSELQSLMRISYAVFCLKKNKQQKATTIHRSATVTLYTINKYNKH